MAKKNGVETPLMKQYYKIKGEHPDAILLFRVGDFYETFGEDAIKASEILGITLTKRSNGAASKVELAGFPHHALDTYLPKLVQSGQRVAVCDQLEDPKMTKKIVKRGVTELVTPGTSLSDQLLKNRENNFLASIHFKEEETGLALLDLSTGEFFITQGTDDYIANLVKSLEPTEVIHSRGNRDKFTERFGDGHYTFTLEDWLYTYDFGYEKLLNHFNIHNLKGFGVDDLRAGITAAGAILHYLEENKHSRLSHITGIQRLDREKYIWLDRFTIRNLEILETIQEKATPLVRILDSTITPMGGRMLRKWLVMPLKNVKEIRTRQEIVEAFFSDHDLREEVQELLKSVGDLERLISRAAMQRINPREVVQIKSSLEAANELKIILSKEKNPLLKNFADKINPCKEICSRIGKILKDEPPASTAKGGLIRDGINKDLDTYRELSVSGKDYLVNLQKRETANTGIPSLKIGFNNVFGYYLEVRNTHKNKVPSEWVRKQTLVNAERYITEELKEYEEKILHAEEKILELENKLYLELVNELEKFVKPIQENSHNLSELDVLQSFADVAHLNNYVKPEIHEGFSMEIKNGRHPVIEKMLPLGEEYIPNDIYLDNETQQVIILTGPNMSGKSAILRQTALIVLIAQTGGFVPASEASIGIVDKIFTRVGASDNLSVGESTFMVEMSETASILNNISSRSLVLLDEIGRGTSTYDGVSIAWSMTEFLHNNDSRPKTLFATHYHELNEMSKALKRIRNFHVSVKEYKNKIIFLRKLSPGGSEHSFGINVAQMAGVPEQVVERAKMILHELESQRGSIESSDKKRTVKAKPSVQLSLFAGEDPEMKKLKEEIEKLDINVLTPVEALMKLNYLKGLLKKK